MANIRKTFDISKFQKSVTKSVKNISSGFNDPSVWIDTGNLALNKRISGDFHKGIPIGKVSVLAGESGCVPADTEVRVETVDGEKTITVSDLRTLFFSEQFFRIQTPDGYSTIVRWFDKGFMPCVTLHTETFTLTCAESHLIQKPDGHYVLAGNLDVGDKVLTALGIQEIIDIQGAGELECFDFEIGHPNHRYYANSISSHNSGKSFIAASIAKHAQEQGIFVVFIDTENALDQQWLENAGVDTSSEKMLRISATMIDDVAKIFDDLFENYKTEYADLPQEEQPNILVIVDSLGMLMTKTDVDQFKAGDLKGDMGRKPKALKALMTNLTNAIGKMNIGVLGTNHTYKNQDIYSGEGSQIASGGSGPIFSASIIGILSKLKLKVDENGNKTSEVHGIRSRVEIVKTRFSKPFEKIELEINYATGLDRYSGLFEYLESKDILTKAGNKWLYTDVNNVEHKYYEKEYKKNINGVLDLIISEWKDDYDMRSQKNEPEVEE